MTDFLDIHIKNLDLRNFPKIISNYINTLKIQTNRFANKSKIQIEIEKTKIELNKKYKVLGEFINSLYLNEKVRDFSYKEDYFILNKEIYLIKQYLHELIKEKKSIK